MSKVTKEYEVVVLLDTCKIEGTIYLHFEQRLSDFINAGGEGKDFFPMTKAKIYSLKDNSLLNNIDFITINRKKITLIFLKKDEK